MARLVDTRLDDSLPHTMKKMSETAKKDKSLKKKNETVKNESAGETTLLAKIWQIFKFLLVGVSNTLISEGIYALLVLVGAHYLVASFVGFTVSIFTAFLLSSKFVFKEDQSKEKRVWWKVLIKTYLAYIVGFLLNLGLLTFWMEGLKLETHIGPVVSFVHNLGFVSLTPYVIAELIAEAVNLFLVTPVNFLLNKYWAYRQKPKEEAES